MTEECLLNANRNPSMTHAEIEASLRAYTGATTVVWLGLGVVDDETDGHVDNLACFVRPGVVVLTGTDDRDDPQYPRSEDARRGSRRPSTPGAGRSRCTSCTSPGRCTSPRPRPPAWRAARHAPRRAGDRLAASYVNFYPADGVVVVPLLDPRHDAAAVATLAALYPGREVVGVPAREILLGGGNIHCITQPVPAG